MSPVLFAAILAVGLLAGCSTGPQPRGAYSPTDPKKIQILLTQPGGIYEELGTVSDTEIRTPNQGHSDASATLSNAFGPGASQADDFGEHQRDSPRAGGPNPYNELRKQAAALGADAVLITERHLNRSPRDILNTPPLVETFSVTGVAIRFKREHQDLSLAVPPNSAKRTSVALDLGPSPSLPGVVGPPLPALPASPPAPSSGNLPTLGPLETKRMPLDDSAVRMKPFIVNATQLDGRLWSYSSLPGMEILSRASKAQEDWLVRGFENGLWIFAQVLPKGCAGEDSVPLTLIIDDQGGASSAAGEVHPPPLRFQGAAGAAWGTVSAGVAQEAILSSDDDAVAVGVNVHNSATERIFLSTSLGLRERLLHSAPPFPAWFVVGLFGKYGIFRTPFVVVPKDVSAEGVVIDGAGSMGLPGHVPVLGAVGPETIWLSPAETRRLELAFRHPNSNRQTPMLPLADLFAETPPSDPNALLWASEAGLWARWALLGPGREDPTLAAAFARFLQQARRGRVTERSFIDCFGFGYAAMEQRLYTFLAQIIGRPAALPGEVPWIEPPGRRRTEASADQIGRILGDWLRMEGDIQKPKDPQLSRQFLNAAGRVLLRAYREDNGLPPDIEPGSEVQTASAKAGNPTGPLGPWPSGEINASRLHDPSLLAVFGLYENDIDNVAKAREFLEASCRAQVVRPLAYLELTWLRYGDALAQPAGPRGQLSAPQLAALSDLFFRARQQTPRLADGYKLLADSWTHTEAKPSGAVIAAIEAGASLFPRNGPLGYKAALVLAQHGYPSSAATIVDRSAAIFSDDPAIKDRFERLRLAFGLPRPTAQ